MVLTSLLTKRWDREQYYRMGELGWFRDQKVELIDGHVMESHDLDPSPRTKRWSREQYYRMAELGWFQGRRVELIDGEIVEMSPQKPRHVLAIMRAQKQLEGIFGEGYAVRAQFPLALNDETEPEPDLAVVRSSAEDEQRHPSTAALVVEVGDSTVGYDLVEKTNLYASGRIDDYWVIDLVREVLVVHRKPISDSAAPMGHRYASVTVHAAADSVSPLAAPHTSLSVADLLS